MQQYLEINPLTLPSLPLTQRHKLPNLSAIYFAIAQTGEVLYIGRSKHLAQRWIAHHRYEEIKTIENVRIAWLHCTDDSLLVEIEQALIKHFLPALNRINYTLNEKRKPRQKKENIEKLIEIIKLARGSMSQRAFGKLLGVSATAVQMWEKGETIPQIGNLTQIAARAGYKLDKLLEYLKYPTQPQQELSDLQKILRQIKVMPLSDVVKIAQAATERFAQAAEYLEERSKNKMNN